MKRRLSGWVRLWIVFAIGVWAIAALATYGALSDAPRTDLTPTALCRLWAQSAVSADELTPRRIDTCLDRDDILAEATEARADEVALYHQRVLYQAINLALIPLLVAGVWMIGGWVWRGFRPSPPPSQT